ncbi:sensor histidine kinase [Tessaracoccus oleiagri]|uniref:Oxygen sensor histidine kinase NreB n=1 Tax=Tessaracoccus oleiagri TaxID=686624 RepID=A0A1G9J640_9ACTN|nr:sensor histidine kinase [Tessaracoccus oleiagri]SDL32705.1 Signal transduction histidine kinase [Tessaracoccus oleiagri]
MRTIEQADSAALRSLRLGQHLLFALLLGIAVFRLAGEDRLPWHALLAIGVTVVWYAAGVWLAPPATGLRARVWFGVLVMCWLVLTLVSAEFSWLAFPLFLLAMKVLPLTWALVTVTVMTAGVVVSQTGTPGGNTVAEIVGPAVGALVAVGIGLGYQQILEESRRRGELVEQLTRSQEDLVAMQAELAAAQREAGALGERARLARDIHDTVAQGFSSILLLSRAGQARSDDAGTRRLFSQISDTAAENLADARDVVAALAPASLVRSSLPTVLERQLERLAEQTGVKTDFRVEGDARPAPTAIEVALLRLAQGALANVRAHSKAARVTLTLTWTDDEVLLDVVDDGIGFDVDAPSQEPEGSGFGLRAMSERLADLGGRLTIESTPGAGTAVGAALPLGPVR